ncbi:hypothetical protein V8J88_23885 [Massilia sp. W12]|uniref:hypothetical protein n=1 Tax=Massilia sp. W12 TaxID=3126507 RepID=UPI0030D150B3
MTNSEKKDFTEILNKYHHFDDGLFLEFGFYYLAGTNLCAKATFYARDYSQSLNIWRKVTFILEDVSDFKSRVIGGESNVILSGVTIFQEEEFVCLDVDGTYSGSNRPSNILEVKENGVCYIIAKRISFSESEENPHL